MDDKEHGLNVSWSVLDGEGLVRVIPIDTFRTGIALVTELGKIAEAQNHHPELLLTNDKVVITLYSHDENSVTDKDITFAKTVDKLIG